MYRNSEQDMAEEINITETDWIMVAQLQGRRICEIGEIPEIKDFNEERVLQELRS